MYQGSRVSEMTEGWQEARSHRQQSPLPAIFFFFSGDIFHFQEKSDLE